MMEQQHTFKAKLIWTNQDEQLKDGNRYYEKSHTIQISEKPILKISAAKAFKGDPTLYNPEDLLLTSLMSCHMMSFLYVCAKQNIKVVSYEDNAIAHLEVTKDGSGRIIKVSLYPSVKVESEVSIEVVNSLHAEANKLCFIANSCSFTILHFPTSEIL